MVVVIRAAPHWRERLLSKDIEQENGWGIWMMAGEASWKEERRSWGWSGKRLCYKCLYARMHTETGLRKRWRMTVPGAEFGKGKTLVEGCLRKYFVHLRKESETDTG